MRRQTVHRLGSALCVVVAVGMGACDGGEAEAPGVGAPAVRIAAESAVPAAAVPASASASASDSACGRAGDRCLGDAQCCGGFTCEDFPEGSACVAYTEPDPQATDEPALPIPGDAVATTDDVAAKACGRTGDTCLSDASCCGGFVCQKFPEGRACVAYGEPDPQTAAVLETAATAVVEAQSDAVVVVPESACGRAGDLCRTDAQCCGGFICQEFPEGRACAAYTEPDPADAPPAGGYREPTRHPR